MYDAIAPVVKGLGFDIWDIEYKKIGTSIKENKTNIYKASQGFSFLGYTYRVVNDKLL